MEKLELIFIPTPMMGHATQALHLANLMINRFDHLSITVLIMKLPVDPISTNFMESLGSPAATSSSNVNSEVDRIRFHHLPPSKITSDCCYRTPGVLLDLVIEDHKDHVRNYLVTRKSTPAAALVVDMFCTTMMDVGNQFGIPTYVFFTSGAAFLQLLFHLQILHDVDNGDVSELINSDTELVISGFVNPIPPGVLPFVLIDKYQWSTRFLKYARACRKANGIIVNTFVELESHALNSLHGDGATKSPPIYPVGPIINHAQMNLADDRDHDIMRWLDDQPRSSVVFLCFGSMGGFDMEQVREIANGIELSGYRFLWSLRHPAEKGKSLFPTDYSCIEQIFLPDKFFERTAHVGKVIGWGPQLKILAHEAVGGFVSHCGWNSILESLWHGVPIATWPIYSEQQLNAFEMVRELGLSVEIKLDYHNYMDNDMNKVLVRAEEIERGIRSVMDGGNEVREKVKRMRDKSRMSMEEGGSSYKSLELLIEDMKV